MESKLVFIGIITCKELVKMISRQNCRKKDNCQDISRNGSLLNSIESRLGSMNSSYATIHGILKYLMLNEKKEK